MSATSSKPSSLEIGARLFSTPKESEKGVREQADALVCDLPTSTLRWIKKRRNADCEVKVVLSHQRERQLREMFESLDFEGNGEIDLPALTEAVTYVQEKTKNSKGMKDFHNIHEVFAAMDDNGDGTIDFTEFTRGMTGTMKSAFDKATEYDIDRLFRYFVQFGELRQRDMALKKLNIINTDESVSTTSRRTSGTEGSSKKQTKIKSSSSNTNTKEKPVTSSNKLGDKFLVKGDTDLQTYQQFKVLFGNPPNGSTVGTGSNQTVGLAGESSSLIASANGLDTEVGNMNGSVESIVGHGGVTIVGLPKSPKKLNEFRNLFKAEKLLDDFIADYETTAQDQAPSPVASNNHTDSAIKPSQDGSVSKSEKAMNSLQSFTSAHHKYHPNTSYYNSYTHQFFDKVDFDPEKYDEYKKIHEKLKIERREDYEALLNHQKDAYLMEQRAIKEKKHLKTLQSPAQVEKIKTNPKALGRNQLPTLSINRELNLRTVARHEAFDTLRSSTFSRDFCLFGGFSSSVSQDTFDFTELSLNHSSHSPNGTPSIHSRSGMSNGFSRGQGSGGGGFTPGQQIPTHESVSQLTNTSECYAYEAYRKKNAIVLTKNPVAAIKNQQKRQKSPPPTEKLSLSQPISSPYQPQQYTYHQQTPHYFQQQQRPATTTTNATSYSAPNLHQVSYSGQNSPTTRGTFGGEFRKGSAMEYSQSLGSLHGQSTSAPFGHISSSIHMSHSNQS